MAALLITTDLMATSSAEGDARRVGVELSIVAPGRAVESATATTRLAAIDLTAPISDLPALIEGLRTAAPGVKLVAYGPHVHEARLQAARDAGCDLVISRGQFHKGFAELLKRYASAEG